MERLKVNLVLFLMDFHAQLDKRRICSECGKNFNVASINIEGKNGKPAMVMALLLPPPNCASKLITRADDIEAVVKESLRIHKEMKIGDLHDAINGCLRSGSWKLTVATGFYSHHYACAKLYHACGCYTWT
ncbi:hypothetical protein Dimus_024133 [Dionaea muscipula]